MYSVLSRKIFAATIVAVLSLCLVVFPAGMALASGFATVVNYGDSIWYLSQKYGTPMEEIRSANGLWGDLIYAGETLWIPTNPTTQQSYVSSQWYSTNQDDVYLLARLIRSEAEGEPYVGQVAVGAVVLNRVRSPLFPDTISGVIFEQDQFEPVLNGTIFQPPSATSLQAARDAMSGWDPTGGALYFFNPSIAYSAYLYGKQYITAIGKHIFLR